MRSANGGSDQSASTTEQDGSRHARMWILVSFGSDSGAEAKADKGSDQSMAPVASLAPHSRISPPLGVSNVRWNWRAASALCKF